MEGLLVLLALAILAMPILVIVALVKLAGLRRRVEDLEQAVAQPRSVSHPAAAAASGWQTQEPPAVAEPDPWTEPMTARATANGPAVSKPVSGAEVKAPLVDDDRAAAVTDAPASTPAEPVPARSRAPAPEWPPGQAELHPAAASSPAWSSADDNEPVDPIVRAIRRWFTEGNVPVKVGMLVLFAGVAALIKYVADQGWMRFPIELRLAGIAFAAMVGLVFAWRQRERKRTFALSLQGGAIGILLMTVYAAFRLYDLLPAGAALTLSVVLVAGSGVLAVVQNAVALAVLGILAGFLAPVLMNTGGGNHVALFSYYAVLNAAIFAIAWYRPWRALNLLGFVFTFGIGTYWGVLDYRPEKLASTLPFLGLFFAFYLLVPIFYARRLAAQRRDLVDGALVFGNPLFSFLLLAGLLDGARLTLAFGAIAMAAIYTVLAWLLLARERYRPLAQAHAVLAVGFATLAVPLALSARVTATVFALEGAALIWLGLRQHQRLARWAGTALQVLAALAFVFGSTQQHAGDVAIANPGFIGALVLALAGFASAWSWHRAGGDSPALAFYLWGGLWWLVMAGTEIDRYLPYPTRPDAWLGFVALSLGLVAITLRRYTVSVPALAWTLAIGVAAAVPLALAQANVHLHPFANHGLLAWSGYAVLAAFALHTLRTQAGPAAGWAHSAWLLAWTLAISLWLERFSHDAGLAEGWQYAAVALPWLLGAAGILLRPDVLGHPLAERFDQWRATLLLGWQLILGFIWLNLLLRAGDAVPLPWLPIVNPLELVLLACLVLVLIWHRSGLVPEPARSGLPKLLTLAAFATVSAMTLRAVHQLGGVPWDDGIFRTALAQASLSLVWSVLGVAAWIVGSRRQQRTLWLAGAVLMAVVLGKLIVIDRQHLGDLFGIASFIGYGLLCTAVGYFAPAPPREPTEADPETAR